MSTLDGNNYIFYYQVYVTNMIFIKYLILIYIQNIIEMQDPLKSNEAGVKKTETCKPGKLWNTK